MIIIRQITKKKRDLARYDEKNEDRRGHTLLPSKPEQRDADGADCGNDKPPTIAYPKRWATCYIQSGICGDLPLSRYVC